MRIKRSSITTKHIEYLAGTEVELEAKRQLRKPLLEAFDLWEKAVIRGREVDDPAIMEWFAKLKDLDTEALREIPERIRYYL